MRWLCLEKANIQGCRLFFSVNDHRDPARATQLKRVVGSQPESVAFDRKNRSNNSEERGGENEEKDIDKKPPSQKKKKDPFFSLKGGRSRQGFPTPRVRLSLCVANCISKFVSLSSFIDVAGAVLRLPTPKCDETLISHRDKGPFFKNDLA